MKTWTDEAAAEIAELEAAQKADPKAFYYASGVYRKATAGGPDGAGGIRAAHLAATLETLARRARGLVRAN